MSRDGFAIENEFLSEDRLENFTINRFLLFGLNLLTLLGLEIVPLMEVGYYMEIMESVKKYKLKYLLLLLL